MLKLLLMYFLLVCFHAVSAFTRKEAVAETFPGLLLCCYPNVTRKEAVLETFPGIFPELLLCRVNDPLFVIAGPAHFTASACSSARNL